MSKIKYPMDDPDDYKLPIGWVDHLDVGWGILFWKAAVSPIRDSVRLRFSVSLTLALKRSVGP